MSGLSPVRVLLGLEDRIGKGRVGLVGHQRNTLLTIRQQKQGVPGTDAEQVAGSLGNDDLPLSPTLTVAMNLSFGISMTISPRT